MLHGAGGTGGLPPSPYLHPVCRHVSFFMLICPFLMLSPSFSYAPRRTWDGHPCTRPTFFGAILYAELAFFMLRLSFSYAPWGTFHPSPCLSLHLHVSILLSTCLFSYAHGSFSYACGFSFYAIGVFFLICPFLVLSPLLLMLHGAGGTGEGHPLTRPDLFWC